MPPAISVRAEEIPTGDAGLQRLQAFLRDVASLRAVFRQQVIDRDLELVEEASGRVVLQRPGRFRWDYTFPYERVIVADGQRIWLYEADLEQVTVRRLTAGLGETPAALLTGELDVLDRFDYQGFTIDGPLQWVELQPQSATSDFESIRLAFTDETLVQLALEDRLGQTTRLYLTDVETNPSVLADTFTFEVPDGVDVIGETEL